MVSNGHRYDLTLYSKEEIPLDYLFLNSYTIISKMLLAWQGLDRSRSFYCTFKFHLVLNYLSIMGSFHLISTNVIKALHSDNESLRISSSRYFRRPNKVGLHFE